MGKDVFLTKVKETAKVVWGTVLTLLKSMISKFKALPKKIQLVSALACGIVILLLLILCFAKCGDRNVNLVKKTILEYDTSRNIETALEARCSSLKWESFKSPEGYQVVEVTGIWKDSQNKEHLAELKRLASKSSATDQLLVQCAEEKVLYPGDYINAQFVISADRTEVTLLYGAFLSKTGEIKTETSRFLTIKNFLKTMYNGTAL